jgi:monothiol glutaredoxin
MSQNTQEKIAKQIKENSILIYMKGNRQFPQCGFSAAVIDVFNQLGTEYQTVDVLEDPEIRDGIKTFSNWPTIPQVYIQGKFIGGCDIVREMFARGELQPLVKAAAESA